MDTPPTYQLVELYRLLHNLVRYGVVSAVDHDTARARVTLDNGNLTDWLPWLTGRAGNDRSWWPLSLDEQVVVISPGGNSETGFILPALYRGDFPPPSQQAGLLRIAFESGSVIEHDDATGHLKLHASGDLHLIADGNIVINGTRVDIN